QQQQLMSMVKTGVMVLAVLALIFLAWRASRKAKRSALSEEEMAALDRIQATIETQAAPGRSIGDGPGTEPAALDAAPGAPPAMDQQTHRREIAMLAARQPEQVAQLLRGWLAETKRG